MIEARKMGRGMSQSLRQSDFDDWSDHKDFKGSTKTVGKYRIELMGGTDRGAEILIWGPMSFWRKADLVSVLDEDKISSDGEWYLESQVNFWYYNNAKEEYSSLRTIRDVMSLARRNT